MKARRRCSGWRYHRKAIKLDDLPRFTLFRKKQFLPLIQLLRLGVLLNNQRQAGSHHRAWYTANGGAG
ncbi:hypothetical protein FK513_28615, partial [Klebsiella pneumoniae]|nr:hypothetical protein [Klebsiella pneumoniae]